MKARERHNDLSKTHKFVLINYIHSLVVHVEC